MQLQFRDDRIAKNKNIILIKSPIAEYIVVAIRTYIYTNEYILASIEIL